MPDRAGVTAPVCRPLLQTFASAIVGLVAPSYSARSLTGRGADTIGIQQHLRAALRDALRASLPRDVCAVHRPEWDRETY
jgi:hypothetical protein